MSNWKHDVYIEAKRGGKRRVVCKTDNRTSGWVSEAEALAWKDRHIGVKEVKPKR